MDKKPVFVDPRLRRVFERQIVRPLAQPELWKSQRIQRVFLYYGQKGSGMEESILQLLSEHPSLKYTAIKITKDAAEVKKTFETLKRETSFVPLLIIRKGHFLKYYRELFLTTHSLKTLPNVGFIILLSEDIPDEESPFWEQFTVRIPNALPNKDFYKQLLDWYIKEWELSGSPASAPLSPALGQKQIQLDTDELAICCSYCTQSDVKRFIRSVISVIIDLYPESRPPINMDFLKEHGFLFPFAGSTTVLSISRKDGHVVQMRYDPTGITEAPGIDRGSEPEQKKLKFTMEGETKQITEGS